MTTLFDTDLEPPQYPGTGPVDNPWPLALIGTPAISLYVYGNPAPQGSKNARAIYKGKKGEAKVFTGKVALQESSKKVGPWRDAVAEVARFGTRNHPNGMVRKGPDVWELLDGPLVVEMVFTLEKGTTLPKWMDWHFRTPDLSKLARSTEDALTGIVWADDARISDYRRLAKRWVGSDDPDALRRPGAVIRVWQVPEHLIEDRKDRARRRQL